MSSQQASSSSRFLSRDERLTIVDLVREGATVRVIAAELGRAASTVSSMSMMGFAAEPGTGVEPMCSTQRARCPSDRRKSCVRPERRLRVMLRSKPDSGIVARNDR